MIMLMRESIQVQQIRCERCVNRMAQALAPLKGLHEARVEMGTSSVIVAYEDALREQLDAAITGAGFTIVERTELAATI
jgi:copper chaperone CopZ